MLLNINELNVILYITLTMYNGNGHDTHPPKQVLFLCPE